MYLNSAYRTSPLAPFINIVWANPLPFKALCAFDSSVVSSTPIMSVVNRTLRERRHTSPFSLSLPLWKNERGLSRVRIVWVPAPFAMEAITRASFSFVNEFESVCTGLLVWVMRIDPPTCQSVTSFSTVIVVAPLEASASSFTHVLLIGAPLTSHREPLIAHRPVSP